MEFHHYKSLLKDLRIGKRLPTAIYIHRSALQSALPNELLAFIELTADSVATKHQWNVIKLFKRDFKLSFLHYPDFDTYAYPALAQSLTIDLLDGHSHCTQYQDSDNPPILHRKETFVGDLHPKYAEFCAITEEGLKAGLYENTRRIGFKKQWLKLIKEEGYQLDEQGRLHPYQEVHRAAPQASCAINDIQRHLTAITRDRLSAPFQKLAKYGYLDGDYSILDYGCGLGDDATELEAHGLNINAWDPVHRPRGNKVNSDIVNLGFVLNVIEDENERAETLKQAFTHAHKLLLVSVMLANEAKQEHFKPYRDGVITHRNTFQKYFSQAQIRHYIEQVLNVKTTPFGQGIIAVFKCSQLEEAHHLELQFKNYNWRHVIHRPKPKTLPQSQQQSLYEKHQELLDNFWHHCLHLGRIPANDEFEQSSALRRALSSHNKAFSLLQNYYDQTEFAQAQKKRSNDLLVYLALGLFGKRKPKSHMPARLLRDLKTHFTSYQQALEVVTALLFSISSPQKIGEACYAAFAQLEIGELFDNHSYILPSHKLNLLPAILRVYIGCAAQLYGDIDDVDLVKIHMRSGKVTLLKYDDFNKKLPLLTQRIKVKLVEQDIDYFFYGDEYPLQPLYSKLPYLTPNSKEHKAQLRFDAKLADMLKGVPKEQWPDWNVLQKVFAYWGVKLQGSRFVKIKD
ncbi:hypothetical protein CWC31_12035 [Pseudoalteromonas ruthenica]|uniref:DNA phosphorothioation-associated putative methyltransferase n=1 Tax=Pseudoalteromonas ruthenica TaxID=151081 RepID=UPI001108A403|nr:DNA phosphorothioation-associated putative methyltransferase [Pseudoalteromonas ruthenica]TLX50375.1 hypothetical protein CWC31_12035 [Pseudoalteromonas ruthenica]